MKRTVSIVAIVILYVGLTVFISSIIAISGYFNRDLEGAKKYAISIGYKDPVIKSDFYWMPGLRGCAFFGLNGYWIEAKTETGQTVTFLLCDSGASERYHVLQD